MRLLLLLVIIQVNTGTDSSEQWEYLSKKNMYLMKGLQSIQILSDRPPEFGYCQKLAALSWSLSTQKLLPLDIIGDVYLLHLGNSCVILCSMDEFPRVASKDANFQKERQAVVGGNIRGSLDGKKIELTVRSIIRQKE